MRILYDENGAYDLAHVVSVMPVHSQNSVAGSTTRNKPTARILLHGGHTFPVNRSHDEVLAAWIAVKESENHPADVVRTTPVQDEIAKLDTPQ